tara:strand:+ start:1809 stop:2159 length:351 start_codon:yes stop_codon:yes gene_type:complete
MKDSDEVLWKMSKVIEEMENRLRSLTDSIEMLRIRLKIEASEGNTETVFQNEDGSIHSATALREKARSTWRDGGHMSIITQRDDGEIEIDSDAKVILEEGGAYVQAWVWVDAGGSC